MLPRILHGNVLPRVALILGLLAATAAPCTPSAIRFAPLPLEDRKIIHEQFQGLVEYLAEHTGVPVEVVHVGDYAEILERFQASEIDLAYLGPLPYVLLERSFPPAEPLACFRDESGSATYTCSLITTGESGLTLPEIKGMHIGLTQPFSTCGYLAVSQMLGEAGLALERNGNSFAYAGSHSEAALGVARGEYDLAGLKTAIAARYQHLDLHVIARSRPFPGFTLVANTESLDSDTLGRLQQALLALDPENDPADRARVRRWGRHLREGTVPASACDYDGVADLLEEIPWPIPGAGR